MALDADERTAAVLRLKDSMDDEKELRNDRLWACVKAYQGYVFQTAGRGRVRAGAVEFSYELKRSRLTGQLNDEIIISRKEKSKSLTRSSVEIALENALEEQAAFGKVSGPKKLKVFGASYLYAMFLEWGLICGNAPKE